MRPQQTLSEKYYPLWEGGKSVEQRNIKVGFKIRMYVVTQMNKELNQGKGVGDDKQKLIQMMKELQEDKKTIQPEDQKCSLEDYQTFLNDFFQNVDYEDRNATVTMKTSAKFRLMIGFIDVLGDYGEIDEEMRRCQKYCKWKAINIVKSLKKGEIPHRGGPNEKVNDIDDEPKAIKLKNEDDIPQNYICPISYEIMIDPVITPYGISYDRESIEKWLINHDMDPIAHKKLNKNMLIPNYALKSLLEEYINANKI